MTKTFREIEVATPDAAGIASRYQDWEKQLDASGSADDWIRVLREWDQQIRRWSTWENLTDLHFQQDTRHAEFKRRRDYLDELRPKLIDGATRLKRRFVTGPFRAELEREFGAQAFALWEADLRTFTPAIEEKLIREAKLCAEYTELQASAQIPFQGETHNLSGLTRFREAPERAIRYGANRAYWGWFAEHREQLDRIFRDQVEVRTAMARELGFVTFTELGYQRMKRVDYGAEDVNRFRKAVRDDVVPLCVEIRERQSRTLGLDRLMFWDEPLHDLQGNPAPQGDHDWMLERATEMFSAIAPEMAQFFRLMCDAELLDLKNRDGKAGGGFCTDFPSEGVPFIFANFNGTKGDVEVFTHEMGHAFQSYMSRHQPLADYLFPTYESCEIHSMGLEFLAWPQMERFFGDQADRFRRIHLTQSLLFLPYGVAVDDFQHRVYAQPDASPSERHAMWREVERTYLPWRDYGDLPHVGDGGFWQCQRHIYLHPFYYIDYALAQTCALQFWARSRDDFAGAIDAYIALCRRGGQAPFQQLAQSAGLVSPFQDGCLRHVVQQARDFLG